MKIRIETGYKVSYKTPEDTHSGWYRDGIQSIEDAKEFIERSTQIKEINECYDCSNIREIIL